MNGRARDWALSGLLALGWLAALVPMLPSRKVEPVLQLTILKNRTPIVELHQRRSVERRQRVTVDVLDLARDGRFAHRRLGELGYGEHFFVDLDASFKVRQAGQYRFVVASDDGFAIYLGADEVCSHVARRALLAQTCIATLEAGEQRLRLRYFQADGPAGLSVQYGRLGEQRLYWFGETSPWLDFTPP